MKSYDSKKVKWMHCEEEYFFIMLPSPSPFPELCEVKSLGLPAACIASVYVRRACFLLCII
jgi:hypothetical protein